MWLLRLVQYLFGILGTLSSTALFAQGKLKGILGGLVVFTISLFCIPVLRESFEKKINYKFSRAKKYLIVIFGYMIMFLCIDYDTNSSKEFKKANKQVQDTILDSSLKIIDKEFTDLENSSDSHKNNMIPLPVVSKGNHSSNAQFSEQSIRKVSRKKSKKQKAGYGNSFYSGTSGYIRGSRGGCYYINRNGRKVYVDRSYCN